jgi:methionyl-tRNA formyltransferase
VGGETIKVRGARWRADAGAGEPGTVLGLEDGALAIATGAGVLGVERLQRPGGKLLPAPDFLRGFALEAGTVLASQPMTELLERR